MIGRTFIALLSGIQYLKGKLLMTKHFLNFLECSVSRLSLFEPNSQKTLCLLWDARIPGTSPWIVCAKQIISSYNSHKHNQRHIKGKSDLKEFFRVKEFFFFTSGRPLTQLNSKPNSDVFSIQSLNEKQLNVVRLFWFSSLFPSLT